MRKSHLGLIALVVSLMTHVAFAEEAAKTDAGWKANVGANGIIVTGNSNNQTFGGTGLVSNKWDDNKVELNAAGNYGRSKDPGTGVRSTNTKNSKFLLRYDRFITDRVSLFGLGRIGFDQPAGLDLFFGGGLGVAHEIIKTDPHYFKYELGYDFQHEERVTPPDVDVNAARLYGIYKLKISDSATFSQDAENIFNLEETEDYRLNTVTSITAKLTDKVALQAGFEARYRYQPVPGFKDLDTRTLLGIIVNFL